MPDLTTKEEAATLDKSRAIMGHHMAEVKRHRAIIRKIMERVRKRRNTLKGK